MEKPNSDLSSSNKSENSVPSDVAAQILCVTPGTLAVWRWRGCGPAYHKPNGRKVVYRRSELERYLQACAVAPGKDYRAD
jgi:hypothetical protein